MSWLKQIVRFRCFKTGAWFFGVFPAVAIIFLLPNIYHKYELSLTSCEDISVTKRLIFYEDLDSDGVKDRIDIMNYRNISACCFLKLGNKPKRQFNFKGFLPKQENLNKPIFCDVTSDGFKDVFVFSQIKDSLFLNAVNPAINEPITDKRFISTIGFEKANRDFVLRPIINYDYNYDGIPELYFLLNGGFALYPRTIMAYDFANDTLFSIGNTGAHHFATPIIKPNGELLILSNTRATDNCPPDFPYPYRDNSSWLFGFNGDLSPAFTPKCFKGEGGSVKKPLVFNNSFDFFISNEESDERRDYWCSMTFDGQVLTKKPIDCSFVTNVPREVNFKGKQHFIFSGFSNEVFQQYEYLPDDTLFRRSRFIRKLPNAKLYPFNINANKQAFVTNDMRLNKSSLWLDNFKYELLFDSKLHLKIYNLYLQVVERDEGVAIVVTDRKFLYTYLLSHSSYYSFRFVFYSLIYLLNVALVFLSEQLYRKQFQKRNDLKMEIVEMQLKLINSQLEPHFVFNALNMVSSKILKGDKYEAYDLMTSFSNMMRSAMSFSSKVNWSLKEEIGFVTNFLVLMRTRFSDFFTYNISISDEVDGEEIMVPRLLVQNAVENAIKHAFWGVDYEGVINIDVGRVEDVLTIVITDNGIGLEKGKENSSTNKNKSGIGMRLNEKQIITYNELYNTNILFSVKDTDTYSSGTRVEIQVPIN